MPAPQGGIAAKHDLLILQEALCTNWRASCMYKKAQEGFSVDCAALPRTCWRYNVTYTDRRN